ncbi:MAG: RNA polymerase sigma factor [Dehalococcoidales bacterium]|nr:RNA polymerase sigma factor [Dehalococcoidales bacterium]
MTESEEAALICRCQAGDKDAFRTLIKDYKKVMFGTAYLMTKDYGMAEDAVQEAMIQIWEHLPSLRLRGSFKAWLMRIVINQVNRQLRKKHLPTVPLEYAPDVADDSDRLETAMIRNEEHRFLRRTLEKLPTEQREAVVLRYFSDLTVPEVAKVMGKREGTIKSRLSRALNQLHEIIVNDEKYGRRR